MANFFVEIDQKWSDTKNESGMLQKHDLLLFLATLTTVYYLLLLGLARVLINLASSVSQSVPPLVLSDFLHHDSLE